MATTPGAGAAFAGGAHGGGPPHSFKLIEVLTFDGCPHAEATRELVARVAAELEAEADVVLIDVPDQEAAATHRFLGSPTVRVDGRDIEPRAERRDDVVLGCRIYRTDAGLSGPA